MEQSMDKYFGTIHRQSIRPVQYNHTVNGGVNKIGGANIFGTYGNTNVNVRNTYINNGYGGCGYGYNMGYGNCDGGGSSGWFKAAMGVGILGTLAGTFMKLFGKGGDDGQVVENNNAYNQTTTGGFNPQVKGQHQQNNQDKYEIADENCEVYGNGLYYEVDGDGNIIYKKQGEDGQVYSGQNPSEVFSKYNKARSEAAQIRVTPPTAEDSEETPPENDGRGALNVQQTAPVNKGTGTKPAQAKAKEEFSCTITANYSPGQGVITIKANSVEELKKKVNEFKNSYSTQTAYGDKGYTISYSNNTKLAPESLTEKKDDPFSFLNNFL